MLAVHTTTADPELVEVARAAGMDGFVLDLEHGTASDAACANAVRAADALCIPVIIRIAMAELQRAARLLDIGVAGVYLAGVRTPEDVRAATAALLHPPFGDRGVGGTRANAYGTSTRQNDGSGANAGPVIGVQLEDPQAIRLAAQIVAVPGVAVATVGTRDLAMKLGHPGQLDHPDVLAAAASVARAVRAVEGVAFSAMARTPEQVPRTRELGAAMILIPLVALLRAGRAAYLRAAEAPIDPVQNDTRFRPTHVEPSVGSA